MTAIRARWAALDPFDKRTLFVVACVWTLFHLVAVALTVFLDGAVILGILLVLDAAYGTAAGAVFAARRLFPDKKETR